MRLALGLEQNIATLAKALGCRQSFDQATVPASGV